MNQIIEVGVRVRPCFKTEVAERCCSVDEEKESVTMNSPNEECFFDFVKNETSPQKDMFQRVGNSLVSCCLNGNNATLFAYGQTGSGKTYTVFGNYVAKERKITQPGLVPRCLELLFQKKSKTASVSLSMFEIYNDSFYDLMNEGKKCEVKADISGAVIFSGLLEISVRQWEEALTHTINGYAFRKTSSTKMNSQSSRSHCITIIRVGKGTLVFVDLAGSERIERSGVIGTGKLEAGNINKTLTALGRVIRSLVAKEQHIPFRDCKLTSILKNSMLQSERICFIATISSSISNAVETWGTLNFARNTKNIKMKIRPIELELSVDQLKIENEKLKLENEALKTERDNLKRKVLPDSENFEYKRMQADVKAYKELIRNNPSVAALQGEKTVLEERLREAKERIDELVRSNENLTRLKEQLELINQNYLEQLNEKEAEVVDLEEVARSVQHRLSTSYFDLKK
ncbi:kinesin motor domain containing protein [Entamoeba histolytica HM-1:IMSS-B]|uniref:Kinesin-like protein n=6 Tax=Entamoeba histolytica TaxID=5759 RepID=C4M9R1_ENTH1|nr:kinesin motor domain-containing protein [Entamoeba histolytica HM-1:IMSS]EMD42609.1 kinesin motor domain containing protein [Entamoeba histolytica KU27]EMH77400.1 kinesin motor domain containing protein [Entamoeba histolytica HM-1:IMSS-B]EMS12222.1 kinesin motor domain containing protein [Entamoeba histolytica HM-3:IMSS]ENY62056.1 kinesin motor domain containing protein [Entamoeba histolytica HM-1:IMSS-A]EAL44081.1 kinesin motor domain-containing protein [Entamoeba histolytica HM-1:IMSS]|eukprot:XP_649467.1 kinesin motor domain-containing protein [Entamoeba histolytica HM-1:IMSS]